MGKHELSLLESKIISFHSLNIDEYEDKGKHN